MSSGRLGKNISKAEVTHISTHGLWVLVGEREYLLPYSDYPWFSDAKISDLMTVKLIHGRHIRWPSLDVDIEMESLEYPDKYPLVYQSGGRRPVPVPGK
jgi:hypothetical protein